MFTVPTTEYVTLSNGKSSLIPPTFALVSFSLRLPASYRAEVGVSKDDRGVPSILLRYVSFGPYHRLRISTEEKAKVVAAVLGIEFIKFLAAPVFVCPRSSDDLCLFFCIYLSSLVPTLGDSWQEKSRESGFGPAARKQDGGPCGGQEPVIRESATAHPGGQEQAQQREDYLTR